LELGARVSVATWAAGGARCSPGTTRSKDRERGVLEKGGIVSVCLRGKGRGVTAVGSARGCWKPGQEKGLGRGAPSALESHPEAFVGSK
jgi:hypothetical protein